MAGFPRRRLAGLTWAPDPQEFFSKLQERTVAYINVDISVFGMGAGGWADGDRENKGRRPE